MLKEALEVAENTLLELEDNSFKTCHKRKKINIAVEKAYATLNLGGYSQRVIDKRTDEVWNSMLDDSNHIAALIFFFGILLSGTIVFTVYQAYAFFQNNLDAEKYKDNYNFTGDLSSLVKVNYKSEGIVSLYDESSAKDSDGLKNVPQEFTISNNSNEEKDFDYVVNYYVYLTPLNDPSSKLIDKKFIKYRYTFKDSSTGKYYESKVGTLDELSLDQDGSMLLTKGTQNKDSKTDFKVTFWVGLGTLKEENSSYTFKFKVDTDVAKAR